MKPIYILSLFLLWGSCQKDKEEKVRKITHGHVPVYAVGDTLRFSSTLGFENYLVKEYLRATVRAQPISGSYLYERVDIKFTRVGDIRNPLRDYYYLFIDDQIITFVWNECPQQAVFPYIISELTQTTIAGRTYHHVLEKRALCYDSLNPMRLTYDLDSGIIGYVDSNHVQWTLVPR